MRLFIITVLFILLMSCQEEKKEIPQAKLFEAGKLSTEAPEFATTLNASQDLIFFNRTTPDRSSMRILYSQKEGEQWSEPDTLPFSTGQYRDVDPFVTADGNRLYFSSNRPTDTLNHETGEFNTWYVDWQNGKWSEPVNPGYPLNSDSTEIFVSMTQSGNAYFVSERGEKRGIMVSKFENGSYQEAEPVDLKLRGEVIYASNPCIASDESFLIVASRDPLGSGTPDLFVSWNENDQWSEMINLGEAVNTPYAEFAPGLTKDDQILYFSSERPGILPAQEEGVRPPGDIYQVDIQAVLNSLK